MTAREAVGLLRMHRSILEKGGCISGTVGAEPYEIAVAALQKQIPEAVRKGGPQTQRPDGPYDACPSCGGDIAGCRPRYCQHCGQKLDWEGAQEGACDEKDQDRRELPWASGADREIRSRRTDRISTDEEREGGVMR